MNHSLTLLTADGAGCECGWAVTGCHSEREANAWHRLHLAQQPPEGGGHTDEILERWEYTCRAPEDERPNAVTTLCAFEEGHDGPHSWELKVMSRAARLWTATLRIDERLAGRKPS